jgi:DNA-binding IclR family transcriptional regulator
LNRPLRSYTPHTTIDPAVLAAELKRIRERGYATSESELEIGAKSITVPIFLSAGNVGAALTLAGPAFRLTNPVIRRLIPEVVKSAQRIARRWNPKTPGFRANAATCNALARESGVLVEGTNHGIR